VEIDDVMEAVVVLEDVALTIRFTQSFPFEALNRYKGLYPSASVTVESPAPAARTILSGLAKVRLLPGAPIMGTVRESLGMPKASVVIWKIDSPIFLIVSADALARTEYKPLVPVDAAASTRPLKPVPLFATATAPSSSGKVLNCAYSRVLVDSRSKNMCVWLAGAGTSPFMRAITLMPS